MPIVLAFSVTITASKNSSIWYNSSTGVSESTVGNAGSITSPIFFANASFGEPDSDNTRKIVFSDILPTIFSLSNTGNWESFFARIFFVASFNVSFILIPFTVFDDIFFAVLVSLLSCFWRVSINILTFE